MLIGNDEKERLQRIKKHLLNEKILKDVTMVKSMSKSNALVSYTFNVGGKNICGFTFLG